MRNNISTRVRATKWSVKTMAGQFIAIRDLFIFCYRKISEEYTFDNNVIEDKYRNVLLRFANKNKVGFGLRSFHFTSESGVTDDNDITVGRIDICILGLQPNGYADPDKYFAYECKRLSNSSKNDKYINDGMSRFTVDEKYSPCVDYAGMIGFIEKGKAENIISDIGSRLLANTEPALRSNIERITVRDHSFTHAYKSTHVRKNSKKVIELTHLFFNFVQKQQMKTNR